MSDIHTWSTTAANNNSAAPNGWPEGQLASSLNNCGREMMAAQARLYKDLNGSLTTGGSSNAYTLTPNRTISAYEQGLTFTFTASFTSTNTAPTLNVSSLGAKTLTDQAGNALGAGEIVSGGIYTATYDNTAGKFKLISQTRQSSGDLSITDGKSILWGDGTSVRVTGSNSTGVLTLFTNNTERARIDNSGNVGFNTSAAIPAGASAPTVVYRTSNGGRIWAQTTSSTQSAGVVAASNTFDSTFTNVSMTVGGSAQTGTTYGISNTNIGTLQFTNTANAVIGTNNSTPLIFATNASERMRIDSSGKLLAGFTASKTYGGNAQIAENLDVVGVSAASFTGIGVCDYNALDSTPTYKLAFVRKYGPSAVGNLYAASSIAVAGWAEFGATNSSGVAFGTNNSSPVVFGTNATERMRIDSSGNVGVGVSPAATVRLQARGSDTTSANFALYADDSAGNHLFYARNDGLINTGTRTNSPYNNTTASAANVYVDSGGTLQRSTSSLRYKTDVTDAAHGLADVLKLRSVTYKGKTDGDTVFGGLIAEEVHDAGLTEFVAYDKDGQPDALYYGNMVALAFKAIQEQQRQIDALTSEVAALKAAG